MAKKPLPSVELLRQLIRVDGDRYYWRPRANKKSWNTRYAGTETLKSLNARGYLCVRLRPVTIPAHRVVWALHYGEWPTGDIDHINGIKTDNRIENLRMVSHAENMKNQRMRKTNTSGRIGVSWTKHYNYWVASITHEGKDFYLGSFSTFEDAVAARRAAEIKFGFHINHGLESSACP